MGSEGVRLSFWSLRPLHGVFCHFMDTVTDHFNLRLRSSVHQCNTPWEKWQGVTRRSSKEI
ncbi:MAG: hypothetical protein FWH04_03935 [Oscillospiraceae bacterium]|nr:hypothetical protein [Oscillospiraceae bacterium]